MMVRMKRILFPLLFGSIRLLAVDIPTDAAAEALRKGLFAEEALRDFKQASQAYQEVIDSYTSQRLHAGTALFRLAEIKRKQGDKDSAAKLYQRVAAEFGEDETLVKLSRENLLAMGMAAPVAGASVTAMQDEEEREIARVTTLAKNSPDLLNTPSDTDPPPLIKAVSHAWLKAAEFALKSGARLTQRDKDNDTALHAATAAGHKAMVVWLLEQGADVNAAGRLDHTPLATAFERQRLEIFKLLLERGANPNVVLHVRKGTDPKADLEHNPLLGPALQRSDEAWFDLLLAHKADPNLEAGDLQPVHYLWKWAESSKGPELLKRLLEAGGRIVPGKGGRACVLHEYAGSEGAKAERAVEMVKLMLDHGGKELIDSKDYGRTPLINAARVNHTAMCKLLLEAGADPNIGSDSQGAWPPLASAAAHRNLELAKLLVAHGAKDRAAGIELAAIEIAASDLNSSRLPWARPDSEVKPLEPSIELVDLLLEHTTIPDMDARLSGLTSGQTSSWAILHDSVRNRLLERVKYSKLAEQKAIQEVMLPYGTTLEAARAGASSQAAPTFLTLLTQGPLHDQLAGAQVNRNAADLSQVVLVRKKKDGSGFDRITVDLQAISKSGNFDALPALQWGDVLELSHGQTDLTEQNWETVSRFDRGLRRQLTVKVGENSRTFIQRGDRTTYDPLSRELPFWDFRELVRNLGIDPRIDQRRVRVVKATGAETIVDLAPASAGKEVASPQEPPGTSLELADGDTVELPFREAGSEAGFMSAVTLTVPGSPLSYAVTLRDPKFTLAEALAELLASDRFVVPFPDWAKFVLVRWNKETQAWERRPIDLVAAINAGRMEEVPLRPGDFFELPVKEGSTPEAWKGLGAKESEFFAKSLAREVMISLTSGQFSRYELVFSPMQWSFGKDGWEATRPPVSDGNTIKVPHMGANAVLAGIAAAVEKGFASAEVTVSQLTASASKMVLRSGDRVIVNGLGVSQGKRRMLIPAATVPIPNQQMPVQPRAIPAPARVLKPGSQGG